MRRFVFVAAITLAPAVVAAQDELPSDVTFALRRSFLEELMTSGPNGRTVGARWQVDLLMGERSNVHDIGSDCELHVGARLPNSRRIATPGGLVVEPPNVCKRRVPQISQTGGIKTPWQSFFDANVVGQRCTVTGFPRIFSEHASGGTGATGGSNPDHVVEIHPITRFTCGDQTIDYIPLIRIFPQMAKITAASTRACLEERTLAVRQRGSGDQIRYEFVEEGAKGPGGRCGNFISVEAHLNKDYLRQLSNDGDHVALARVWVGESGPYSLKLYTFAGTPVDAKVAALLADPDSLAQLQLAVHGVLTYDYFTIVEALQDDNFNWLPAERLEEFKEIRRPLALVVFGTAEP